MANVYDVANFFVELAGQNGEDEISNMKLNKLLYFAQGHYLAKTGKPLFDDDIEAWDFGPVIPAIYHKYKICGKNHIVAEGKDDISSSFTDEEYALLLDIAREYCKYTASYLMSKTHEPETPWALVWEREKRNAKIDNEIIKAFFLDNKIQTFDEILATKNITAIGRRDENGTLVLPSDEDDEYWDKY